MFGLDLPAGFLYRPDFLTADDETTLAADIGLIPFDTFSMRGVVARRRVKFYGVTYDGRAAGPMPAFLLPIRARLADWAALPPDDFQMALINEYPIGATIGWHRDAPQYGITAGVSLLASCRMKLRPYVSPAAVAGAGHRTPRRTSHDIPLEPRSAYLMTGVSRTDYEHSVAPTKALRYSVTFRTLR